ncbi:MAG TPA: cytosine deaminase [Anaerolineales bacterium]|nr:cytosine deaminase [Anaerolineales bacterium]
MAEFDILIRRARLRGRSDGLFDIGITNGRIAAIEERIEGQAQKEIDAQGNLVTESFVNPHLHLCKVYTLQMMDEEALKDYHGEGMGKAMTAIELAARVKEKYDESWIIENVRKALREAVRFGNTHIRAFADVDTKAKMEGVKALIRAREEFKGIVDVQVVAFPQDGVVREPGAADLVRQAMDLGADVVGGIPWIEYTDAAAQKHIDEMFKIAKEYDKPISMLVDDAGDPGLRTLEMLAVKTIEEGWHGRSLAHHARAMELYPKPYFQKVVALLKQAQMGVVSDPQTGPLHARVKELLEEGALVCLGQDDISDAYYPYGRNNMLEVAFLVSHLLWMTTRAEMETLYDMITIKAAEAIGVTDYGLEVGKTAHLVVLTQPDVLEAFRHHEPPAWVISHGRLVEDVP